MKLTLQDRLLRRELGGTSRYSAIEGLYGDKTWINDLDIVNELGGHSGCVNALRQVARSDFYYNLGRWFNLDCFGL